MLNLDDDQWKSLNGGYRIPVDLRSLLSRLESEEDRSVIWDEIWQELYHQGDVGEASFVAIPYLAAIHKARGDADWNTYAITSAIELARGVRGNPDVPSWAQEAYDDGLRALARQGLEELEHASDQLQVRSILGLLAIVHGARTHGRILTEFTEDELLEIGY